MNVLVVVLTLGLLGLVVLVVGAPLRAAAGREPDGTGVDGEHRPPSTEPELATEQELLQELEAEREAKYREIRDAELDFRTGKLSREDFDAIDAELRAEAIAILDRLQAVQEHGD